MTLARRVAALEREAPADGRCRCPGSFDTVMANDLRMNPLPIPPPKVCGRCGGVVPRVVVEYRPRAGPGERGMPGE